MMNAERYNKALTQSKDEDLYQDNDFPDDQIEPVKLDYKAMPKVVRPIEEINDVYVAEGEEKGHTTLVENQEVRNVKERVQQEQITADHLPPTALITQQQPLGSSSLSKTSGMLPTVGATRTSKEGGSPLTS